MARQRQVQAVVNGPIETGGNDVQWPDIEALVESGQYTTAQIAGILNNDFRHFRDTTTEVLFEAVADTLEMIDKDLGRQQTPTADTAVWQGWFDQWNRDLRLGNPNQQKLAIADAWSRVLRKNVEGKDATIPTFDPNPPQDGIEQTRWQIAGYTFNEWQNLVQLIAINDAGVFGGLSEPWKSTPYDGPALDDAQLANDTIKALTGGRRFGIVTAAEVQAVIDQNDRDVALNTVFATNNTGNANATATYDAGGTPQEILDSGNAWI